MTHQTDILLIRDLTQREIQTLEWEIKWRERRLASLRSILHDIPKWLECDKSGHSWTIYEDLQCCKTCGFYPWVD